MESSLWVGYGHLLWEHWDLSLNALHCSSDELYAYLSQCRPDLCLLEGGGDEEDEEERDEEDFVLVDNREPQPDEEREEEEEEEEEQGSIANSRAGEDWEVSHSVSRAKRSQKRNVLMWFAVRGKTNDIVGWWGLALW